jgi:hypothetical protein
MKGTLSKLFFSLVLFVHIARPHVLYPGPDQRYLPDFSRERRYNMFAMFSNGHRKCPIVAPVFEEKLIVRADDRLTSNTNGQLPNTGF